MAFEVSSVVADDGSGLAALDQEAIEFARHPEAGDRCIGDHRQALACAVINHDQNAHAAAVDELIGDEVERPAVIRPLGHQHRRPCAQRPLSSDPTADHETLVAIDSEQALVVHQEALPSQQDVKAPVAEAPALMGQGTQPLPQSGVVRPAAMTGPSFARSRLRCAPAPLAHVNAERR